jgi:hypothetical protein
LGIRYKKEEELWAPLRRYMCNKLGCDRRLIWTDRRALGRRPDLLGIRRLKIDEEGDEDDLELYYKTGRTFEIIAVEVKKDKSDYLKGIGQAFSYSLFADKCYLAIQEEKSELYEIEDTAKKSGVGLIRIWKNRHYEVISPKSHFPEIWAIQRLLDDKHIAICSRCGQLFKYRGTPDYSFAQAIKKEKVYFDTDFWGEFRLCKKCIKYLKEELREHGYRMNQK